MVQNSNGVPRARIDDGTDYRWVARADRDGEGGFEVMAETPEQALSEFFLNEYDTAYYCQVNVTGKAQIIKSYQYFGLETLTDAVQNNLFVIDEVQDWLTEQMTPELVGKFEKLLKDFLEEHLDGGVPISYVEFGGLKRITRDEFFAVSSQNGGLEIGVTG
jgi:hypothetical protein